jgi:putative hemolysin
MPSVSVTDQSSVIRPSLNRLIVIPLKRTLRPKLRPVTTNDILEAIVGDIAPAGAGGARQAVRGEDGSWLLDGALPVDEFRELFPVGQLPGEGRGGYYTLAGFVMTYLGRVPSVADHFEWQGLRSEVVDMDGKRVDKVLVAPAAKGSAAAGER